ncbi:stromal cell-derived factor 2-like isoform X1 [Biomphalaria pfeifferi]|uniref:Stromal cell-derived factor 2-like isoform X1 n=1 Tax=Biomphalaria pfeifferi TaxID=112525 RepID=A0AAD8FK48_BIOPF|nr:stromal cell-derived factor 2-like isoform X1 [Biomphalaria pfeifferi]
MAFVVTGRNVFTPAFLFVIFTFLLDSIYSSKFDYDFVTCGSALKILNTAHNARLHSHDVKYGSGSGQQSVTGVDSSDDHNSYWQVMAKTGTLCTRGNPVKCGQTIRLMHVATKRNLHSHHFQSPLSHNLEVSAFGEDGEGDEGDNWVIVCNGKYWSRNERVRFKHVTTEYYLHMSGDTYGRPIHGQREISAYSGISDLNSWQAAEGIYIKPTQSKSRTAVSEDNDDDSDDDNEDNAKDRPHDEF